MLITIGVTSYNAAETLGRAVQSAYAQDWPDIEVVIVDDASSDAAAKDELIRLRELYPLAVIYEHKTNKGVAGARNTILSLATGEFVAFFDDDDYCASSRLRKQYDRICEVERDSEESEPLVFCYTARTQVYPDGSKCYAGTVGCDDALEIPKGEVVAKRVLIGTPFENGHGAMATCSFMARKRCFDVVGGFDEDFRRSEDTDLSVRAALAGVYFIGLGEPLVTQNMTYSSDKKLRIEQDCFIQLCRKHKDFIEKYVPYAFLERWIVFKYSWMGGRSLMLLFELMAIFVRYPIMTIKKIFWALPNNKNNNKLRSFYTNE